MQQYSMDLQELPWTWWRWRGSSERWTSRSRRETPPQCWTYPMPETEERPRWDGNALGDFFFKLRNREFPSRFKIENFLKTIKMKSQPFSIVKIQAAHFAIFPPHSCSTFSHETVRQTRVKVQSADPWDCICMILIDAQTQDGQIWKVPVRNLLPCDCRLGMQNNMQQAVKPMKAPITSPENRWLAKDDDCTSTSPASFSDFVTGSVTRVWCNYVAQEF